MSGHDPPGVATAGGLLLALLSPTGERARGGQALLKWAGPGPLVIAESRLVSGSDAQDIGWDDAMGLRQGTRIVPPASLPLVELRRTPAPLRWRVNGLTVAPAALDPAPALVVVWLPLLLPLAEDPHFLVAIVNFGPDPLRLPKLVYESRLTIDREVFAFADPGHWDGRAAIDPGASAVLRFRFNHFGAKIPDGRVIMGFACGEWSSPPTRVAWRQC